jgi:hypothetical protein
MAEWDIRADVGKNRLYVTLRGFFSPEESKIAADLVIDCAKKLKPGFDCITDLTTHKPGSETGIAETKRGQAFIIKHGLRRVVRIVTTSYLSKLQFERTGKEVGFPQGIDYAVTSVEEAEKILDQPPP